MDQVGGEEPLLELKFDAVAYVLPLLQYQIRALQLQCQEWFPHFEKAQVEMVRE